MCSTPQKHLYPKLVNTVGFNRVAEQNTYPAAIVAFSVLAGKLPMPLPIGATPMVAFEKGLMNLLMSPGNMAAGRIEVRIAVLLVLLDDSMSDGLGNYRRKRSRRAIDLYIHEYCCGGRGWWGIVACCVIPGCVMHDKS